MSFHRGKKILRDGPKLFKGRFTFFTIYPLNNFRQPPASGNYKSIHAPLQLREQHLAWCQQGRWQSLQTSPLASTGVPPRGYGRQSHTRAVHSPALHSDVCNHIQLFAFLIVNLVFSFPLKVSMFPSLNFSILIAKALLRLFSMQLNVSDKDCSFF